MFEVSDDDNYCVYVHINKINGKKYVGQTRNLKERWRKKEKGYIEYIKFFNALKKYGWDNFSHKVLKENLSKQDADNLERLIISVYNTVTNGYNIKDGGSYGRLSDESIERLRNSLIKGYAEHPDRKLNISLRKTGNKHSEEAKKAIMLHNDKTILINIDGEIGSIRYWARKINMAHVPLIRRLKIYGIDNLINYIQLIQETGPRKGSSRKIYCFDKNTKELLCSYNCIKEAAQSVGVASTTIGKVAKGKGKTSGGFIWSYYPNIE